MDGARGRGRLRAIHQTDVVAGESGAVKKPHHGRITIALCYPNTYELAMGNLGFHQVYHLLNAQDDVACERAMQGPSGRRPRTIESGMAISEFEIIAFSIAFESDLINMATMLKDSGIPLDADQRRRENAPLVLAGGVMAFLNPEPLAALADVVAVGEAEPIIPQFLETYREQRTRPRREIYAALAGRPGLYVPSLYEVSHDDEGLISGRKALTEEAPEKIRRMIARDPSLDPARTRVFTEGAEFGDMVLVELARGCIHACRFCAGAYIYRPPRRVRARAVEDALAPGLSLRERAGLVAASATDHPEFSEIRAFVRGRNKAHSVASLRLDQVSEELLDDIRDCGHKTLTLAPEAGTERLRRIINKPITDRDISTAMKMVGASGIPRLKLYFQVGLPFESGDDVLAIPPLVAMMRAFLARGAGKGGWPGKIIVSINPFVPKPGTPFQWHPLEKTADLKKKLERLRHSLQKIGGVSVSGTSVREAMLQAAIARGDRRTGTMIARAVEVGDNPAKLGRGSGGGPLSDRFVRRARGQDEMLPWNLIDHGVAGSWLWDEYQRAGEQKITPPCRPGACRLCDACGEP